MLTSGVKLYDADFISLFDGICYFENKYIKTIIIKLLTKNTVNSTVPTNGKRLWDWSKEWPTETHIDKQLANLKASKLNEKGLLLFESTMEY